MSTVQHRRLFSVPVLAIVTGTAVLTKTTSVWTVDCRGRHKRSLRGDRVEQTRLVETHTVDATAVGRVLIAGAPDLKLGLAKVFRGLVTVSVPCACGNTCRQ